MGSKRKKKKKPRLSFAERQERDKWRQSQVDIREAAERRDEAAVDEILGGMRVDQQQSILGALLTWRNKPEWTITGQRFLKARLEARKSTWEKPKPADEPDEPEAEGDEPKKKVPPMVQLGPDGLALKRRRPKAAADAGLGEREAGAEPYKAILHARVPSVMGDRVFELYEENSGDSRGGGLKGEIQRTLYGHDLPSGAQGLGQIWNQFFGGLGLALRSVNEHSPEGHRHGDWRLSMEVIDWVQNTPVMRFENGQGVIIDLVFVGQEGDKVRLLPVLGGVQDEGEEPAGEDDGPSAWEEKWQLGGGYSHITRITGHDESRQLFKSDSITCDAANLNPSGLMETISAALSSRFSEDIYNHGGWHVRDASRWRDGAVIGYHDDGWQVVLKDEKIEADTRPASHGSATCRSRDATFTIRRFAIEPGMERRDDEPEPVEEEEETAVEDGAVDWDEALRDMDRYTPVDRLARLGLGNGYLYVPVELDRGQKRPIRVGLEHLRLCLQAAGSDETRTTVGGWTVSVPSSWEEGGIIGRNSDTGLCLIFARTSGELRNFVVVPEEEDEDESTEGDGEEPEWYTELLAGHDCAGQLFNDSREGNSESFLAFVRKGVTLSGVDSSVFDNLLHAVAGLTDRHSRTPPDDFKTFYPYRGWRENFIVASSKRLKLAVTYCGSTGTSPHRHCFTVGPLCESGETATTAIPQVEAEFWTQFDHAEGQDEGQTIGRIDDDAGALVIRVHSHVDTQIEDPDERILHFRCGYQYGDEGRIPRRFFAEFLDRPFSFDQLPTVVQRLSANMKEAEEVAKSPCPIAGSGGYEGEAASMTACARGIGRRLSQCLHGKDCRVRREAL